MLGTEIPPTFFCVCSFTGKIPKVFWFSKPWYCLGIGAGCFKACLLMRNAGPFSKFSYPGFSSVSFPTSLQKVTIYVLFCFVFPVWCFFFHSFPFSFLFSSLVSPSFLFLTILLSQSLSLSSDICEHHSIFPNSVCDLNKGAYCLLMGRKMSRTIPAFQ